MFIKPFGTLRDEYDSLVKLSCEQQEPIYLTRNGEGEMVILPIALYEKREAELDLFSKLLDAERNRLSGAPTYSTDELRNELRQLYNEV